MTRGRETAYPLEENDVALKLLHTADWHLGDSRSSRRDRRSA